jgi:aspartate carbamoyltransferase catalytic subunit
MATLFYEPSTRTRVSFESAMYRLGGTVISTENAREFSSAAKGETLEDTIHVMSAYVDVIVLRHDERRETHTAARAAEVSRHVPIINAGCGRSQHPTQALLDLYTIRRERKEIDGIRIAFVGDLKYGRTVRSLCYLLGKFSSVQIYFVAPTALQIESDILAYLDRHAVRYTQTESLKKIISEVDVVYMTRIQKERMPGGMSGIDQSRMEQSYRMTVTLVKQLSAYGTIMHPLPRNSEIDTLVDAMPQAAYFRQAENGLYVRMALLETIFAHH